MKHVATRYGKRISVLVAVVMSFLLPFHFTYSQTVDMAVTQVDMPSPNRTVHPGRSFTPSAVFRNVGTIMQTQVPVRFEIMNFNSSVVYVSDKTISYLTPAQNATVSFDPVSLWLPSGRYQFRVSHLVPQDADSSNDRIVGMFFVNWDSTASMGTRRRSHTANLLPNGKVLIAGGDIPTWIQKSCELYNPDADSGRGAWEPTAAMSVARTLHAGTTLPDGRVLATGGVNASFQKERSCEIFDPSGNRGAGIWHATDSMTTGRYMHSATLLKDGRVLIAGGIDPDGVTATCELFDPAGNGGQGTWSAAAPLNEKRSNHAAVLLSDGRVLVTGGQSASFYALASCEMFDPSANGGLGSWTLTAPMSTSRLSHRALLLANGKVLVTGGLGAQVSEIFDPTGSGSWSQSGTMATDRTSLSATLLPDGKVLATGGGSSSCEIFDPNVSNGTGAWTIAPSMAYQRSDHTVTLLPNGKLLAVGGYDGTTSLNSCELFGTTESTVRQLPTHLHIAALSPDTPAVNHGFDVVVETEEPDGQPQNVDVTTTVHLSLLSGTGTLSGTTTGTIPAGENRIVISGVTYDTVEDSVRITVAATSGMALLSDTSAAFTIIGVPAPVEAIAPENGTTLTTNYVRFVWQKSHDAITAYWLEMADDSLFSSARVDSSVADTTRMWYRLADNSSFWWRVKVGNRAGWSSYSTARRFMTNITPSQPQAVHADPGNMEVTLTWRKNPESDVARYYVLQGNHPDTLQLVDSTTARNDTSIIIRSLTNDQLYYFCVAAFDSFQNVSQQSSVVTAKPSLFVALPLLCLDTLIQGVAAYGDYDNDGWFDALVRGGTSTSGSSSIYRNMANGMFHNVLLTLVDMRSGDAMWCDYNNDNKLDVLLSGFPLSIPPTYPGTTKIYRNEGGGQFVDIGGSFGGFGYACAYGDYDNDGKVDLIVSGWNGTGGDTKLYHNEGAGTFVKTHVIFPPAQFADLSWADYDNDGDMDLLMAGGDGGGPWYAKLFRNDGPIADTGWAFTDINAPFTGINTGSVSWGDYDVDGNLDLVIVGYDPVAGTATAKLYRNDGGGNFSVYSESLPPVIAGSAEWGDYDNDGRPDLAICQRSGSTPLPLIFHNDGNAVFTPIDAGVRQGTFTSSTWGDFDNDGDLDLVFPGSCNAPVVYRNNLNVINNPPAAPDGLGSTVTGSSVRLTWRRSTDLETPSAGLSYNLSIGTSPSGCNIMSPMANLGTGLRMVPQLGNVDEDTAWVIRKLPAGTYYWTVQAIDPSFAGSPFASIDSFTITTTGVEKTPFADLPREFTLDQNYPNPWNPSTTIRYGLPRRALVTLSVFDLLGREVVQLANGYQDAGYHQVVFHGDGLATGIYFYSLRAGDVNLTRRLLLLK